MADFTITVTNNLNVFGASPSTKWNDFLWGSGLWGEGTNSIVKDIEKTVVESLVLTDALTLETDFALNVTNTMGLESNLTSETLTQGDWNYVFTKPTTNAQNRNLNSFTVLASPTNTWTSAAVTSGATWSSL